MNKFCRIALLLTSISIVLVLITCKLNKPFLVFQEQIISSEVSDWSLYIIKNHDSILIDSGFDHPYERYVVLDADYIIYATNHQLVLYQLDTQTKQIIFETAPNTNISTIKFDKDILLIGQKNFADDCIIATFFDVQKRQIYRQYAWQEADIGLENFYLRFIVLRDHRIWLQSLRNAYYITKNASYKYENIIASEMYSLDSISYVLWNPIDLTKKDYKVSIDNLNDLAIPSND